VIPVSIVTGFLGSGKTTLIGRVLRDPGFARTAVIVNEFGEIGLDRDLIASGDETLLALTTGCLCCAVRSDLIATLLSLRARSGADYDRVLIETSGLADPGPILQALMLDAEVRADHAIDTVATVVDAVHGEAALDNHPEARRQAALADVLAFSKTDLAPAPKSLLDRVRGSNPLATCLESRAVVPGALFGGADPLARAARLEAPPEGASWGRAVHSGGIETVSLRRARPLPALALTLWLEALTEHCGERLLRMKGLVGIEEMPGQPAAVHGVRHVFSAPDFLPAWPSADTDTRLVFVCQDMPRFFPARLLEAIEEEVREELAVRG